MADQFFKTSDLVLVAALHVSGFGQWKTERVERPDARHDIIQYVFERSEDLEEAIRDYSLGDIRVEPRTFFEEWRRSRQAIDRKLGRRRT